MEATPQERARERRARLGVTVARAAGGGVAAAAAAYAGRTLGFDTIPPLGWLCSEPVSLTLGVLLGISAVRFVLPLATLGLWTLLLVVAYTPLAGFLARSITQNDPPEPAPAVAVLSSAIRPDGTPDAAMQQRLARAYALLEEGRAPRLVLTRLRRPDLSYVPYVMREMRERGLRQPVLETEQIHNTHDEILALRGLAKRQGWSHLLLVTDPMHSRRAAALARKAGLRIISSPGRYAGMDYRNPSSVPERLGVFRIYLRERWLYRLNQARGWL